MIEFILDVIFLVAEIAGIMLVHKNPNEDDPREHRRSLLGFMLVVGSNILMQVYDLTVNFMKGNMFGFALDIVLLVILLIGCALVISNSSQDPKGEKRIEMGLMSIAGTLCLLLIYNLFGIA